MVKHKISKYASFLTIENWKDKNVQGVILLLYQKQEKNTFQLHISILSLEVLQGFCQITENLQK